MLLETRVAHPFSVDEAARLAHVLYGLDVSAKSLPGEHDDNFHLTTASGDSFVLKIMHPARDRSLIDLQCQALRHLAKHAPNLPLPRVVPSRNGNLYTPIAAPDGTERLAWLLTFVPGKMLAEVRPHNSDLLNSIGRLLGEIDVGLQNFSHPSAQRELKWNSSTAGWIKNFLHEITDQSRRGLAEKFLDLYQQEFLPVLPQLRRSVIYGDANDHNVLVAAQSPRATRAISVIDFGDMHHGVTASEIAIAAAYAILGKKDVLRAAVSVVAGYHAAFPLEERELAALYTLVGMRLAVSVTNSAHRKMIILDDPYVTISEAPAWDALHRWSEINPRFAHYALRDACHLPAVPQSKHVQQWLTVNGPSAAPILTEKLRTAPSLVFDLSVGSPFLGADPQNSDSAELGVKIVQSMKSAESSVGIGRYDEARLLYTSPLFGADDNSLEERRTIHLGMDFFVEPGTPIQAPLDGVVHILANNIAPLDYGPLVILKHDADGEPFFTLYGHLSLDTLNSLQIGQQIARSENFARVGDARENGGWPPHLHFQIILDLLDLGADYPGVAVASQRSIWTSLSPDPNLLVGIPEKYFPPQEPSVNQTLDARRQVLGANLSLSYDRPLKIVRGWMQHLYDDTGRAYLDLYNNVPLVGHSHPRVVRAIQEQVALLNTNTRYLHDLINRYARELTARIPKSLSVCFLVNSGSEANELAIRLARAHTRREDIIVLAHAYHGNTNTLIDLSPYKFDGPGGRGKKSWVHVAPLPDNYRGPYRRDDRESAAKYAAHVGEILQGAKKIGGGVAAYIAETLPSVGGQIVFPEGYLRNVYEQVRAAGGVCIADEVQVGFGRLGTHFWGFETQNVVPDIVVLGKPIGNGFPLGAVITTPEIARSFSNGMEFFSTFGGNPVACAAGLAVLHVLQEENLQEHAMAVGTQLKNKLQALHQRYPLLGDVRGSGLFLGIDLVSDRETRAPAPLQASYVVNRLRECGILTGTDGPHHNVIKIRPPLIISEKDTDLFAEILEQILSEDLAQPSH
ncbi:MAG: aminotransferase class III-fold pyridoxal phosphate-dependent enzyme [Acidobacteriota bacterium]|nr:aminotransferase class III-fold pyridoxal phosphate-dependent enzyme [Acidobacteriota bacterium]